MGFLKRIFSLGSKKNKKERSERPHNIIHNVPALPIRPTLPPNEEEEHEAAVGRLLRSSSARFAITPPVDYSTLPPLPHPINEIIQPPLSSAASLASSTISQRGTYNVTVHGRKRHTSTEFPNANRQFDEASPNHYITPLKDNSNALRLRSDPSVASLLDLYDEHGRLPTTIFSNSPPSPPKEGRAQCRRNGSTLRQLLGAPSSTNNENTSGNEGDISWAERFLGETNSISSQSSFGPYTPKPSAQFSSESLQLEHYSHDTFTTDNDLSLNAPDNPAISSMDVELSMSTNDSLVCAYREKDTDSYLTSDPRTPRRASQIFGFLTGSRRSKILDSGERPLPDPPSTFSSPSEDGLSQLRSRFSSDSSTEFASNSPSFSNTPRTSRAISRPRALSYGRIPSRSPSPDSRRIVEPQSRRPSGVSSRKRTALDNEYEPSSMTVDAESHNVRVIMTIPTKVIVTAPTPSQKHGTPSRIPLLGPRAPTRRRTSVTDTRPMLTDRSQQVFPAESEPDPFTPALPRKSHRRTASQASILSLIAHDVVSSARGKPEGQARRETTSLGRSYKEDEKENNLALSAKIEIPQTPLRTNSSPRRSLFRSMMHQDLFKPPPGMTPSPASSSELSPLGKKLMVDVRQQRMKAREHERERESKRSVKSGLRDHF